MNICKNELKQFYSSATKDHITALRAYGIVSCVRCLHYLPMLHIYVNVQYICTIQYTYVCFTYVFRVQHVS